MRIGMEEAVGEDHLEHHAGAAIGDPGSVDPSGIQCREIIDLDAADALQREHPGRGLFPEHAWKVHRVVTSKVRDEPLGVPALAQVIRLSA